MRRLLIIACLVLFSSLSFAQSDTPETQPSPLIQALSAVPDNTTVREAEILFSFADYHAAISAAGFEIPQDWAEFTDNDPFSPIILPPAGPSNLLQYLLVGGPDYPEILGFDFFQIGHALEFGLLPGTGQVLLGEIAPAHVVAAFTARDYTFEERDSGFLLCPAKGCDSGLNIDMRNRMPENPFGGHLGRSEISYVQHGTFLNSADEVTLLSMTYAVKGSGRTLADSAAFQAADHVLSEWPYVSAVTAINPLILRLSDTPRTLGDREVPIPEGADAALPRYDAVVFASVADEERQYGLALLMYPDVETAEIAAAAVDARLEQLSLVMRSTYAEVFADLGDVIPAQVITDEATGLSVVVFRIGGLTHEEAVELRVPHIAFMRFMQGVYSQDTEWLHWTPEAGQ
jgi:hypothetical protein